MVIRSGELSQEDPAESAWRSFEQRHPEEAREAERMMQRHVMEHPDESKSVRQQLGELMLAGSFPIAAILMHESIERMHDLPETEKPEDN